MNKVLIGMDFSKGSLNALEYAVELNKNKGAELLLLWVEPSAPDSEKEIGIRNEIRHDAKLELQKIISEKKRLYPKIDFKYKLRKGRIYKEISNVAMTGAYDLAIIGTHGIGGFEEFWVGSNAYKIINYCPCPVISVRTDFSKLGGIKKILLPIDGSIETTKKVPMAVKLAMDFNSTIEILGVYESDLPSIKRKVDHYIAESKSFIENKKLNYHFIPCHTNNPSSSLVKYAEKLNADLMVIMTDQNKANLDILMGRNAQQIINQSSIPVLSVKPFKMD
jgi:nucleotide-binding universal stress UspA family protein